MLLSEIIATDKHAPVLVLFGGNPYRRDEVIRLVETIGGITIYGALSEEEGMDKLQTLPKVDLVLIGGRYDEMQRVRIRKFVKDSLPNAKITEPGWDYPYDNQAIKADIIFKLNIQQ